MAINHRYESAEKLLAVCRSLATYGFNNAESKDEYNDLRKEFMAMPDVEELVPHVVRINRNSTNYWEYIKTKGGYADRRELLRQQFEPLLAYLEKEPIGVPQAADVLAKVDSFHVGQA